MIPKSKEEAARTAGEKARENMNKFGSCAQSTLLALQDTFDMRDDNVFKAAGALTGGIGGMNDACGSLLGASLMFGQVTGRSINDFANKEKINESMTLAGQLYKWYEKEYGSPTCADIRKKFGEGFLTIYACPGRRNLPRKPTSTASVVSWQAKQHPAPQKCSGTLYTRGSNG